MNESLGSGRPRLRIRLLAARLALLWERLVAALWLPLSVAGLALAVGWSDLLPRLPGWLHALVLGAIGLTLFGGLVFGLRGFRWPGAADARHRLEASNPHRPLTALDDRRAQADGADDDPLSAALWQAHTRRMAEDAQRLHAQWPAPTMARRDPYGLRVVAALALVLAGTAAWQSPDGRLARALSPALAGLGVPPSVDVWVTPPDYTGMAPLYRSAGGAETADGRSAPRPISVPEGSTLLVLIHGGDNPEVVFGDQAMAAEALADGTHRLETTLRPTDGTARLVVEDGATDAAAWPLTVIVDRPPVVAFAAPPSEAGRWRLKIPLTAYDDYGVAAAAFHFTRDNAATEHLDLPLPGGNGDDLQEMSTAPLLDLTSHRWAGLEVDAHLSVTDANGQQGRSDIQRVTLPHRVFEHPVAQRIAELRRALVVDPDNRVLIAPALRDLAADPEAFDSDTVVFLGLTLAANRLIFAPPEDRDAVVDLLWDLALRVEEGDLAEADRALAEAERALKEALRENAPAAEIKEKVTALRQAIQRYMQAMAQQMPMADMANMPAMPNAAMSMQDMEAMLQQLGDLSELGAQDAAQAMLDQLQQMLGNLRNARPMPNKAIQDIQKMMQELGALTKEQEALLNQTFQDNREAFRDAPVRPDRRDDFLPPLLGLPDAPPPPPGRKPQSRPGDPADAARGAQLAERQEALRQRLGDLLRDLARRSGGQVPQPLGSAERAMGEASGALSDRAWVPATDAQGKALDALRQGQAQALQQMMQSMGAGGMALMPGPGGQRMGSDPLGRATGGVESHGVDIPTDASASRARDIMMELRRRSNDRARPPGERDYIRRLLERF